MNNDSISRKALKAAIKEKFDDFIPEGVYDEIGNAPTVETVPDEHIKDAFETGYKMAEIKLGKRPQGEWVRKEDVIHSIAKQYSEHNELVPIWLSIGDMKGGADNG